VSALLQVVDVRAGYGSGQVLHGVSFDVAPGNLTVLLGPNGAGKSTMLNVIAGLHRPSAGRVLFDGSELTGHRASSIARCGVYYVTEGRGVFPNLTCEENLRLASGRPERELRGGFDEVYAAFPTLSERSGQRAGTLSGGERRMLALARAFLAEPRLLLLDEPSLGLAPAIINVVFDAVTRFRAAGTAVVLVEQYIRRALAVADDVVILERGAVAFSGPAGKVDADDLARGYLGVEARGRVSRR
jgi:branched-chain amino acid transport system ATP-binding protein